MGIAAKDSNGANLTLASVNTPLGEAPGSTPVDPADGQPFKASSENTLLAVVTALTAATQELSRINSGIPLLASVTIVSKATSATGSSYVAFDSQACERLDVVNTASGAVDIECRRGATGATLTVPAGGGYSFDGITNASEIQIRRADISNTSVSVKAEAKKV